MSELNVKNCLECVISWNLEKNLSEHR